MTDNKNVLVLMPRFMGYDKTLCRVLSERGYTVTFADNETHLHGVVSDKSKTLSFGIVYRLFNAFKLGRLVYEPILRSKAREDENQLLDKEYQKIICINGQWLSDKTYSKLRAGNPSADMILYWWDDADNLQKTSHSKYFNIKKTYNIEDCRRYSFDYQPMFTQTGETGHADQDKYDIAIIGTAHPDRVELAKEIYNKYKDKYRFYVYFYHPANKPDFFGHSEPLSYESYIDILRQSKVVLDLPFYKQQGPTTRVFDAALTRTKVITTNKNIVNYPIYSSNITTIDRNDLVIKEDFVTSAYQDEGREVLSGDAWVDRLLKK